MIRRSLLLFFLLLFVVPAHAGIIANFTHNDGTYQDVAIRGAGDSGPSNNKPPSLCCPITPWTTSATVATRHSATIVTTPAPPSGGKTLRFELKQSDDGYLYGDFTDPYNRAELEKSTPSWGLKGNMRWYGFAVYVPSAFASNVTAGEKATIVTQWHMTKDACDAVARLPLTIQITDGTHATPYRWNIKNGRDANACSTSSSATIETWDVGAVERNKWVFWVVQYNWRSDSTGVLRVWKDGVLVVERVNAPVAMNNTDEGRIKWGVYNARWNLSPGPPTDLLLLYRANFRIGDANSSFAEVDPGQGGSPDPTTPSLTSYTPSDTGPLDVNDPTALASAMQNVPQVLVKAPERLGLGTVTNEADYSYTVQSVWTATDLYFLFNVTDDAVVSTGGANWWHRDTVAVRLNSGTDLRIAIETNGVWTIAEGTCATHQSGAALRTGGYFIALQIPKTCFGNPTLAANLIVPFKLEGNDNDAADGVRDAQLVLEVPWSATELNNLELVSTVVNIVPPISPPVITNIAESMLTSTSVVITWTCGELCTCNVDYDTNSGTPYANTTPSPDDTTPDVTACSVSLTGLTANTQYFYRVRSANTAEVENNTEAEGTFTTPAVGTPTITSPEALWISLYGSEGSAPEIDTTRMALGGRAVFRAAASVADANSDATPLLPWATKNGGSATALGSSCATAITCSAPVTSPMSMIDGDFTSQRITTGDFVPGRIRLLAEAASVAVPAGDSTEHAWPMQLSATQLSVGDVVCVSLRHESGDELDGTPAEKCVTMVQPSGAMSGGTR